MEKLQKTALKRLVKELEKRGLERTQGTKIVINGVVSSLSSLSYILDDQLIASIRGLEIYIRDKSAYKKLWIHIGSYFNKKEKEYLDLVKKEKISERLETVNGVADDGGKLYDAIMNRVPVIIPSLKESRKGVVLFDPTTGLVDTETNVDTYFLMHGSSLREAVSSGVVKVARLEFNPFENDTSYLDGSGYLVLNTYKSPPWRKSEVVFDEPTIPEFIDFLLRHLFPAENARNYVLSWICRAVLDRNQTMLCLIGARGTGKTILASIIGTLIGREYSSVVGNSILDDKFNSPMKNNRFILLEEVVAREQEQINKLKSFANNFIPLEEKGQDQQTIRNYNSMMILANEINSICMSAQDRRFSVPEITSTNLTNLFTEEEITDWVQELESNDHFEDIVEFGQWILKHGKKYMDMYKNNIPWKGEHYFRIAKANMPEWQLFIEEYIVDNRPSSITYVDLAKEFRKKFRDGLKFPVTSSTLINFLRDYLYEGKLRLADLDKVDGERTFVINPDLLEYLEKTIPFVPREKKEDNNNLDLEDIPEEL